MINPNDMAFPMNPEHTPNNTIQCGLTKRELFAAMAMQGLLANDGNDGKYWTHLAEQSVHAADALLAELAQ